MNPHGDGWPTLAVTFSGEASETFANLLRHIQEYTVRVTPEDGSEAFDATLISPNLDNGWYDEVEVALLDADGDELRPQETRSLRVSALHIY